MAVSSNASGAVSGPNLKLVFEDAAAEFARSVQIRVTPPPAASYQQDFLKGGKAC